MCLSVVLSRLGEVVERRNMFRLSSDLLLSIVLGVRDSSKLLLICPWGVEKTGDAMAGPFKLLGYRKLDLVVGIK